MLSGSNRRNHGHALALAKAGKIHCDRCPYHRGENVTHSPAQNDRGKNHRRGSEGKAKDSAFSITKPSVDFS